ncbi:MAG: hypothetical protein V1872_12290 [bacterium]
MEAKEIIFMVEDDPEGGYTARALGHSIFTEAETLDELKKIFDRLLRNANFQKCALIKSNN